MAMSELGAYLQRHREQLGLSLEDAEARTRIRRRYLEAIEAGEWDNLPPGVYTRGLLRNYARALGVSPASVLRMFVKERPNEARLPEPQLISQPLIQQPRLNVELVVALGLLAVAVGLFGWMITTQLWPALQNTGVGQPGSQLALATVPTINPTQPTPEATNTPAARPERVQPLATYTPRPTRTPTPSSSLRIDVRATSDAWLMVHTDGVQAFMGFLRKGESQHWTAQERVQLKTGNAGGTQVTLNGARLDALGDPGEVVQKMWRLLPNGDIEQSS